MALSTRKNMSKMVNVNLAQMALKLTNTLLGYTAEYEGLKVDKELIGDIERLKDTARKVIKRDL